MILDIALGGNVTQFTEKQQRGRLDEQTAADFMQQVVHGLQYLHNKQIIHRDIKPDNLLLDKDCKRVRIVEFGYMVQSTNITGGQMTQCGSLYYLAPEIVLRAPHTKGGHRGCSSPALQNACGECHIRG